MSDDMFSAPRSLFLRMGFPVHPLTAQGGAGFGPTPPERGGEVTMKGKPVTLLGIAPEVGEKAPEFAAVDQEWREVKLSDFAGDVVLLSAVPSLDTPVCSLQTKRFNEEASRVPGVQFITISADLPFAQRRFCSAEGIERMVVLSDHMGYKFGQAYGVLVKERNLLARSVFVVRKDGKIAHREIVRELTEHPDYEAALEAARKALGK